MRSKAKAICAALAALAVICAAFSASASASPAWKFELDAQSGRTYDTRPLLRAKCPKQRQRHGHGR